jgi:hypothetical protein
MCENYWFGQRCSSPRICCAFGRRRFARKCRCSNRLQSCQISSCSNLRAVAEDEGEDDEVAQVYTEENKGIVGIQSDVLPSDLVSAYLNETKQELGGSTEVTDPLDAARGSRRVSASFRDIKVDHKGKDLK